MTGPSRPDTPYSSWEARERDVLVAVQRATDAGRLRSVATGLNHVGEHAAGWLLVSAVGVLCDRHRRTMWARSGVAVLGAHAASVVLKRVVRRYRPIDPRIQVLVKSPSRWSFPSSHASSTTAAAVAFSGVTGSALPLALVPAMAGSRLVLGVHYPSDVAAGVALGAAAGWWARAGRDRQCGRS